MAAKSISLFFVTLIALVSTASASDELSDNVRVYDVCARGLGHSNSGFTQTLHIKVNMAINGKKELDSSIRNIYIAQVIKATIWQGKADEVYVEEYDKEYCAASGRRNADISIKITQKDIEMIASKISRGEATPFQLSQVQINIYRSEPESKKRWIRVFFATNRKDTGLMKVNEAFSKERTDSVSYGAVDVSVLHDDRMNDVESPSVFRFERATNLDKFTVAGSLTKLSRNDWLNVIKRGASQFGKPGVLLFVHGFDNTFVDAARRSAQLAYDLAFPGPTVFFSWPSEGGVFGLKEYLSDGRDAENSYPALRSVLSDLAGLFPSGPIYIVAHSMGNRITTRAIMRLMEQEASKRNALREVIMAAPDEDQDTFTLNIAPKILHSGPRYTLYASKHDLALQSSQFIQGGKRMGFGGEALYIKDGLDSVDASAVTNEFFSVNHSYFGDKTTVLSDLFFLIRQGRKPLDRPNLKSIDDTRGLGWNLQ